MVTMISDLITELEATGAEKEVNRSGRIFYLINGEYVAAECNGCKAIKELEAFSNDKRRRAGIQSKCKDCQRKYREDNADYFRKYREENAGYFRNYLRKYYEENEDYFRKYREENVEARRVHVHRRRAREKALPDDLTLVEYGAILEKYDFKCALTGEEYDLHDDHVIPIAVGHGGTTYGNIIPLSTSLNLSKSDEHIFEWFELNRERLGLSQDKFDVLIEWLAQANEMSTQEYRAYVDWCFDNPRDICDETGELVFIDGAINERVTK